MFGDDELTREVQGGDRSLHGIVLEFSAAFGAEEATQDQIEGLAEFVEQAVAVDDQLANAVSTCFLEHLRQIDRRNVLYSRLSREARRHVRA